MLRTITAKSGTRTARKGEPVKGITKTSDANAVKVKRTEENEHLIVHGASKIKEDVKAIQQSQKMKDRTAIKTTNNKKSPVQVTSEEMKEKGDKDQKRNCEVKKEKNATHSTNLNDNQPVSSEEKADVKVEEEPEVESTRTDEDKGVKVWKIDSTSEDEKDVTMKVPELNLGETVKDKENKETGNNLIIGSAVEQEPGVRYVAVMKTASPQSQDASTVQTAQNAAPSVRIKAVNVTSPKESENEDLQNTSQVIIHLRSGDIIQVTEDQISLDLVKLFEKGNADVTEVQKLPGGLVYYALEESEGENQGREGQESEKVISIYLDICPGF